MRFSPAILDRWRRARDFRHRLRWQIPAGEGAPQLSLAVRRGTWHQVDVLRSTRRLKITFGDAKALRGNWRDHYLYALPPLVNVMSRVKPQPAFKAEIGDGSMDVADQLAFSANHDSALLLPDPFFFMSRGFENERGDPSPQRPWRDRDATITWRGSSTFWDHRQKPLDLDDPDCHQRARLCSILRDHPGADAKISTVVDPLNAVTDTAALKKAALFGDSLPQTAWRNLKFAIDIDGNANTYSNLFVRLLYGCCVLKVGSPVGFKQWYYDRLVPWTHYIPVRADLSDLIERVEWCQSHIDQCETIAAAGNALARSMTFENEMTDAVHRVNARQGLHS